MYRFRLIYKAFPTPADVIDGFTILDPVRGCGIMINTLKSDAEQRFAIKHELSHIVLGHFENDKGKDDCTYLDNLDTLEREADDYAERMSDDEFRELMTYQIGETIYR